MATKKKAPTKAAPKAPNQPAAKAVKASGDGLLGGADEQKPAAADTVEGWGRAATNPVKGWYGLRKGFRGRFGVYLPPVLEVLGFAEVEHEARNNRMRAR